MLLAGVKSKRPPGEWILRINSYVNSTESVFQLFNAETGFTQKTMSATVNLRHSCSVLEYSQHQCSHTITINMSSDKKCHQSLAVGLSNIGANGQSQQSWLHRTRAADAAEDANKQSIQSFAAGLPDVRRSSHLQRTASKATIGGIREEGVYLIEKDGRKKAREKAKSRGQTKTSTKKWCKSAGGGRVLKNEKTVKSKSKSGGPSKRGGSGSASSNNKKWIKIAGDG